MVTTENANPTVPPGPGSRNLVNLNLVRLI